MGLLYGLWQRLGAPGERAYGSLRSAGLVLGVLNLGSRQLHAVPAGQRVFHLQA